MIDWLAGLPEAMAEFGRALADPDVPFIRNALIAGLLSSVAFGVNGSYVVARRITYIAAAISHSALGGIGAALYFSKVHGMEWLTPMAGATASALLSAVVIGQVSIRAREREDTVIGAIWSAGMALGLLFAARTPGYGADMMSYLFGNILLIAKSDLWLILGLDLAVVAVSLLFHNKLTAVCFDEEFARIRGVQVQLFYMLLLCLTAMTIILMVRIVGIVMVIALLTIPAAVAGRFTRRLPPMMAIAAIFCMLFNSGGLFLSYGPDLPSGPAIIMVAGATYLAVAGGGRLVAMFRGAGG